MNVSENSQPSKNEKENSPKSLPETEDSISEKLPEQDTDRVEQAWADE